MALLLALITYVGWGSGDIFGVFATRRVGAYITSALVFLFGFLIASLYVPFTLNNLHKITLGLLLLNFLLGSAVLSGNFLLNEAFRRSNTSVIGVIVQSFPAVVLLLSGLIFKDSVTTRQLLWISVIFLGMILCVVNINDFRNGIAVIDRGVIYALIGAVIFSVYFKFLRIFIHAYGWFWPNYISIASFPFTLLLVRQLFRVKDKLTLPKKCSILFSTFFSSVVTRRGYCT